MGGVFLIGVLLLCTDGDADSAATEDAGFFLIPEVAFYCSVGGRCDVEVILCGKCGAVVADNVAAFEVDILVGQYGGCFS